MKLRVFVGYFALVGIALTPAHSGAEIDFFQAPPKLQGIARDTSLAGRGNKFAKVLFFIAPGCGTCLDEAAKLESEFARLGIRYQIEGVFVGDPPQVGKYLAALRKYPFRFEIALDMDGKVAKQYGVESFPSAFIEIQDKKFVVTRASDLEAKLK